jgi:hypothetical protein
MDEFASQMQGRLAGVENGNRTLIVESTLPAQAFQIDRLCGNS